MSQLIARNLEQYVENAIREWEIPGLAISIIRDGDIALIRGFGVREFGEDDPVDEFTVFAIGSVTKPFTTTALAILVDEGRLGWDDPVSRLLPDFQLSDPWITKHLTLCDLLTHRVGLGRNDALWIVASKDRDEILKRIRHLQGGPGFRVQPSYQNLLYLAAGQVIPQITGLSWDEFVHARIFDSLVMNNSSTSIDEFHRYENIASPHTLLDREITPIPWVNVDQIGPAGSINSTITDISNWLSMHINKGQFLSSRVVSLEQIEEMQTPRFIVSEMDHIRQVTDLIDLGAHFWTCGLGWFIRDYHGQKLILHTGDMNRMCSAVAFLPERGIGVVVLSNMDHTKLPLALMYWVLDALMECPERDWCSEFLPVQRVSWEERDALGIEMEKIRRTERGKHAQIEMLTGSYVHPAYGQVEVSREGEEMAIFFNDDHRGSLEHWQDDIFRVNWDDPVLMKTFLQFHANEQAERAELEVLSLYGAQITYVKEN